MSFGSKSSSCELTCKVHILDSRVAQRAGSIDAGMCQISALAGLALSEELGIGRSAEMARLHSDAQRELRSVDSTSPGEECSLHAACYTRAHSIQLWNTAASAKYHLMVRRGIHSSMHVRRHV